MKKSQPKLISNHPMLYKKVRYESSGRPPVEGVCTGVRKGPMLVSLADNTMFPSIQIRIKPKDGSRAFWTKAIRETPIT